MKNEPLVSIIATFYNSGELVHSAMDSLLKQSYKNIEFICVNDGSQDNTLSLLNDYSNKDHRIKVFTKPNEDSPHNAIGFGQKKISGEFVMTFDHDDFLDETTIQKAVEAMVQNPDWDASLFKVLSKNVKGEEIELKKRPEKNVLSGKEIVISCVNGFEYSIRPFIKTKIFQSEDYCFSKTWQNYDEYIGIKILGNCNKIGLNDGKYYYLDNPNSITKNLKFRHIEALEVHVILMKKYLVEKNIYQDIKLWYEPILIKKLNYFVKYYAKDLKNNIEINSEQEKYAQDLFYRCFHAIDKKLLIKKSKGLEKLYLKVLYSNFSVYKLIRIMK